METIAGVVQRAWRGIRQTTKFMPIAESVTNAFAVSSLIG